METAVDTTVPGMTSCRIPENVFSMDGRTLLVEAGSRAFGEYRGAVAHGVDRIFMLWTQIETPHGVIVDLAVPPPTPSDARASLAKSTITGAPLRQCASLLDHRRRLPVRHGEGERERQLDQQLFLNRFGHEQLSLAGHARDRPDSAHDPHESGARVGIFVARNIDMSSVYQVEADDGVEERP